MEDFGYYFIFGYLLVEILIGIIGGILIAACTKKAAGVTYGKLDKAGIVTNILLIPVYIVIAPLYLAIGIVVYPAYSGFLGVLGWIVAIFCASIAMFCGLGLGTSVALRKRGKRVLSFLAQFAGAAALGLSLLLFKIFYGNLLAGLN